MTPETFRHALDLYGADLSRWPQPRRAQAERLVDTDPAARQALDDSRRLDLRIGAAVRQDAGISDEIAGRVRAALFAASLPRQHGRRSYWPAILLNLDFAPAWSRVAALGCCAVLGFLIGMSGLDRRIDHSDTASVVAAADHLSWVVFEPEPLTGARP